MYYEIFTENNSARLQIEMNNWSAENPNIKIHHICVAQSEGKRRGFQITVIVAYERLKPIS